MALLPILQYPDPRLRIAASKVTAFDGALARLVDDMVETMKASRGIGLAATQVDVPLQVLVADVSGGAEPPLHLVNPTVVSRSQMGMVEESCLSVPGVKESVARATVVRVRAQDRTGAPVERELEGLLAVCIEHEIDHLQGRLFVDRLPFFTRLRVRRRLSRALAAA